MISTVTSLGAGDGWGVPPSFSMNSPSTPPLLPDSHRFPAAIALPPEGQPLGGGGGGSLHGHMHFTQTPGFAEAASLRGKAVSYTHLTLPTKLIV